MVLIVSKSFSPLHPHHGRIYFGSNLFGRIFIFIPEILGEIGHLQPQQNKLGTVPVVPQAVWSDSKPLVLAPPGQP